MKEQHKEYCEDRHQALAAGGRVWDKHLQMLASYQELIQHKSKTISDRWMIGAENEFGKLFQGYTNNNIEGVDVLEWIPKSEVSHNKTVTYPQIKQ